MYVYINIFHMYVYMAICIYIYQYMSIVSFHFLFSTHVNERPTGKKVSILRKQGKFVSSPIGDSSMLQHCIMPLRVAWFARELSKCSKDQNSV